MSDTIAAIATPPGEGGIAIIRVSGPEAHAIAARIFRPLHGDAEFFSGYTVHYGRFMDPETSDVLDDGLLTAFRKPRSYTGEESVELSCHGGTATSTRLLKATLRSGARLAEPGEFTQRAFLNGRLDLAQAEAVADVIRAQTEAGQRMARRQLDGALSEIVRKQRDELIGILAAIEVTIDFSDEVGDLDYEPLQARLAAVRVSVADLVATSERGRILREGLRVAFIGRPNVGKSSLFNALLRENRAIVAERPGTTRDRIEETANVGGLPLLLIDVAGLRDTEDVVERVGVQRAEAAIGHSDLILYVVDAASGITAEDRAVAARVAELSPAPVITLLNKRDLVTAEALSLAGEEARRVFPAAPAIAVSALTGAGIEDVERAILKLARGESGSAIDTESVVVSNTRHRDALESALSSLYEAERTAEQQLPGDFIAIDARGALDALGRITGETVTDDIVHRIFRDFCVGK